LEADKVLDSILLLLPQSLNVILSGLPDEIHTAIEEVRIRENRPLEIVYRGTYSFVTRKSSVTSDAAAAYVPTHQDCIQFLDLLANHSLYTLEEELKRGYITVRGGHRIGLAGRTVLEDGRVKQLREISSFNIRIAREVFDAGKSLLPHLQDSVNQTVHHTLIISAPQQGKTTVTRDLARMISYGMWQRTGSQWGGLKVGIVDERSELAACHKGIPAFDVGPRTDVLDSCPKAEGMMMMIRSMSPEVIIVDEIGRVEDAKAIHEALHAGIRVIATAHGHSLEDITNRFILKDLMAAHVFSRYVVLSRQRGMGTVHRIYDGSGHPIQSSVIGRVW
jgi:stage III sporulation protein AA